MEKTAKAVNTEQNRLWYPSTPLGQERIGLSEPIYFHDLAERQSSKRMARLRFTALEEAEIKFTESLRLKLERRIFQVPRFE